MQLQTGLLYTDNRRDGWCFSVRTVHQTHQERVRREFNMLDLKATVTETET